MWSDLRSPQVRLGATGLSVSRLCLGTLTASRWQKNLSPAETARLYSRAFAAGVNFYDTAAIYGTYPHLAGLLEVVPRPDVVLATKSYAATAADVRQDLRDALDGLRTAYVDIFLLHEQESEWTLRGHREALLELHRLRERGLVRAVGISTHHIAAVRAACLEPLVEVIHPLLNMDGTGIRDGNSETMMAAIAEAHASGKGIYTMKPLAGGHLAGRAQEALAFVRDIPYIHAVAVGIGCEAELDFALCVLARSAVPSEVSEAVTGVIRKLVVEPFCEGCGQCIDACGHGALRLEPAGLRVDHGRCVLCGYCAARCPGFHLKVV